MNLADPYTRYYVQQAGSGIGSYYKGASFQKGRGIGSFLGGLFRSAIPLFKSGARALGQEALRAGWNVASDFADSKNLKESLKRRAGEAGLELLGQAEKKIRTMSGGGRAGGLKRTGRTKKAHSRTKSRRGRTAKPKRKPTKRSSKKAAPVKRRRKAPAKRKGSTKRMRDIFDSL